MGIGLIIGGIVLLAFLIWGIIEDNGVTIFIGGCIATFAFLIISLPSSFIYESKVGTETMEISSTEIYSVGLRDDIEGHFTLGCGYIDSYQVYVYYAKDKDGYFILEKLRCDSSKIKESNDISPCIKTYGKRFKDNKANWMWSFGSPIADHEPDYSIIYIPEGSIVQSYKISLE